MKKILIGGSPCTFWSIAQKNNRETEAEGLGWELFKNYLIAKEKFKPDFFLYENNKSAATAIKDQIKKEMNVWDGTLLMKDTGARYIEINSALVSAQNRQRFYVHNCGEVEQPQDRGIVLRDILESGASWREKSYTIDSCYWKGGGADIDMKYQGCRRLMVAEPIRIGDIGSTAQAHRVYSCDGKTVCINAGGGGQGGKTGLYFVPICHNIPQEVRVRKYTCDIEKLQTLLRESKKKSKLTNKRIAEKMGKPLTEIEHWFRTDKCFSVPDENIWFDLKALLGIHTTEFDDFVTVFEVRDGVFEKADRCYDVNGKMSTLMTGNTDNIIAPSDGKTKPVYEVKDGFITIKDKQYPIKLADGWYIIRKLTPIECERLQTLPDNYTAAVSNTQRYKGLGNGWTAEVIIHILNGALKDVPKDEEIVVLSMYDGIGTGRYCLDKMGFTNVKYYAYEIDKYAKQVAMSNYPDIIQMGDAFDLRHPDWTIGY
jgi:DNA (cytosine-5)-methyltransferase 3A